MDRNVADVETPGTYRRARYETPAKAKIR